VIVLASYGPGLIRGEVLIPADMLDAFAPWSFSSSIERPANPLLGDQIQQMYPWRVFVHEELAAGRFPLLNPYAGAGTPLFANGQSAILFPLNVAFLWLSPELAATVTQLLKPPLAAAAMALFLSAVGIGRAGAVLAGLAWAFSGPMVTWLGWPHTNALLLVPALFWATTRWLQTAALRWWGVHAVLVGLQLLGGHPETTAHTLVLLGIFAALYRLEGEWALSPFPFSAGESLSGDGARLGNRPRRPIVRRLIGHGALLAGWVLSVAAGVGMAGIQVVPTLASVAESVTAAERGSKGLASILLERPTLLTWLVPDFFGTPLAATFGPLSFLNYNETMGYVGIGTVVLALVSAVRPGVRGWLALAIITLVAFGLAYGIPILTELRRFPGLNYAANTRFVFLAAFGIAALAAFGLDACLQYRRGGIAQKGPPGLRWLSFLSGHWDGTLANARGTPSPQPLRQAQGRLSLMGRGGYVSAPSFAVLLLGAICACCLLLAAAWWLLAPTPQGAFPLTQDEAAAWRRSELIRTIVVAGLWIAALAPLVLLRGFPLSLTLSTSSGQALPRQGAGVMGAPTLARLLQGAGDRGTSSPSSRREGGGDVVATSRSWRRALGRVAASGALVVVAASIDLFVFSARYNPTASRSFLTRVPPAIDFIRSEDPDGRVAALAETLLPNTAMLFHLHDFRVYEPVADHHLLPYFERLDDELLTDIRSRFYLFLWKPQVPLLSVAGVRWLLVPEEDDRVASRAALAEAGLVRRFSAEGTDVWENPAARSRAYVAESVTAVPTDEEALIWLERQASNRTAVVVVNGPTVSPRCPEVLVPGGCAGSVETAGGLVHEMAFVPGRSRITVSAGRPTILVVNDLRYPGWIAYVDGHLAETLPANYLFMGVPIPAGDHEVVLEYRPPAVALGGMVSFASLALLGLVFAFAELRLRLLVGRPRRASRAPNPIG
jgi:hypothetical protein